MKDLGKKVKVFGAALDAVDSSLKILAKCSYLERKARGLVDVDEDILDPYEGFLKHSKIVKKKRFEAIGKFPISSWVTPKPNIEDYAKINQELYQLFTNSGEIFEYTKILQEFVEKEILPDIPLMIGADHSQSGGVLRALSSKYGAENILVIMFDAHFDAIPARISLELTKYMIEHKEDVNTLLPQQLEKTDVEEINLKDTYTCASFLDYLIKDRIILPENLIVFGLQDYPDDNLKTEEDERVKRYLDYYLSFEERGVRFILASKDPELMMQKLELILSEIKKPYCYISLDVDVCSFREVLAARFMNTVGIEMSVLLEATQKFREFMEKNDCKLLGLDIMEIETQVLNKNLKRSGRKDYTIDIIKNFLDILF